MIRRLLSRKCFCSSRKYLSDLEITSLGAQENKLRELIKQQIKFSGEMKMARYWSLALGHPQYGYYSSRHAFSKKGDFTTSPEISPLFGQIIGVWIAHFIQTKMQSKYSKSFKLLQLGGGTGLLMSDILRTLSNLKTLPQSISMIENSELNSKNQQKKVLQQLQKEDIHFRFSYELQNKEIFEGQNSDMKLRWFKTLEDMLSYDREQEQKSTPIVCVTNEFFDALPVTPLVFQDGKWRERIVYLDENDRLRLGLSSRIVPEKLCPTNQPQEGQTVQICYEGLLTMETLARMVAKDDGAVLTIDYGNDHSHSDSIRAIREHHYVPSDHWLELPGMCDLSAYVDFSALAAYAQKIPGIKASQVHYQGYFLEAMGIHARSQILTEKMPLQKKERIEGECNRLTHPDEMGEIYKVQLVTRKQNIDAYPFEDEEKIQTHF